ncbi:DUF1015 domain-containing protein [bacterium]|nr:DUF1015 domain-containing protein [bacterium]
MPDLTPFQAIRYTASAGLLKDLTAPPYDVIGPAEHAALCARSAYNVVRLILGDRGSAEQSLPDDWYGDAAASLDRWLAEGALQLDPRPAFYLYTHRFEHNGQVLSRKLLLGALRLEPDGSSRILPHENTMPGPKADRLRLTQATQANLSPILGFFPDHAGEINALLDSLNASAPDLDFTDELGITHQLRHITAPEAHAAIRRLLAPEPYYIADGHHRYETAVEYQRLRRAETPDAAPDMPYDFVLAACMSSADPGLVIRPTHRVANWQGGPTPQQLLDAAAQWYDIAPVAALTPDEALATVAHIPAGPWFVLHAPGTTPYSLLALRDEAALDGAPYPPSSAGRRLAATAFAHGFVHPLVGRPPEAEISYTADANLAVSRVADGTARVAALLPAVPVSQLIDVVDAGQRMPPKSTFFWPKPLTGIALRSLSAR